MSWDDILYILMLLGSIGIGYFYRQIEDPNKRKNVGTLIGVVIVFMVSGLHIVHPLFVTLVNACIIKFLDKRKCHAVSFVFSFVYLMFFRTSNYFGIPYASGHANLVQMMLTLKLVGLALEVSRVHESRKKRDDAFKEEDEKAENELNRFELTFVDIFHYAFNYVGVLTGPYYRYTTFKDWFEKPFSQCTDCQQATLNKLKYIPLFVALFLFGSYYWPISYAMSEEFYNERSWLYRYWYIWPNFFIFRMRIYTGIVLSECVCTMAGLGAYPNFCKPKSGQGPSEKFSKLKLAIANPKELAKEPHNFETIHNINPYGADFCTTYREGMKNWNITVQYWLAVNVYQRFPSKSKQTKVIATTLVSAIWHGVYAGYYVCIGTVPMALILEDVWVGLKLKHNTGTSRKMWEWIIWFMKMHFFSYQAIAFILLDVSLIFTYYNSIYHAGLILWFILLGAGIHLKKLQRKKQKVTHQDQQKED